MARKSGPIEEIEVIHKVMKVASRYGFSTLNVCDLLDFADAVVAENKAGQLTRLDLHQMVVGVCMSANRRSLSKVISHVYPSDLLADAFEQANLNNL